MLSDLQIRVERRSLADQAYLVLRDAILELKLRPGTILTEAELRDMLSVSTTPIRQALRQLAADGLVKVEHARSASVSKIPLSDVREMYQLREILETWSFKTGAPHFSKQDIIEGRRIIQRADEALSEKDLVGFSRRNDAFHTHLCSKAGNHRVSKVLKEIRDQLFRVRMASVLAATHSSLVMQSIYTGGDHTHYYIIDLTERGEFDRAETVLREHLGVFINRLEQGHYVEIAQILNPSGAHESIEETQWTPPPG